MEATEFSAIWCRALHPSLLFCYFFLLPQCVCVCSCLSSHCLIITTKKNRMVRLLNGLSACV